MKSLLVIPVTLCLFVIFLFACDRPAEEIVEDKNPKWFDVKGYEVPKDSLTPPEIFPVDTNQIRKYPFSIPDKIPDDPNIHLAGQPKVINVGKPNVVTPGKNGYALPLIVPAIDSPVLAQSPYVVEADDPISKDVNPGNFLVYGKKQGLLHNYIHSLTEDQNGNLWITYGFSGITKFDGKYFTHYTKESGLLNDLVLSTLEDSRGNMWFGTNGGGAIKYDGRYFTHYTQKEGLVGDAIYKMIEDRSGNIWFGSWGNGVSIYNGKTFSNFTEKQGLPDSGMAVFEDSHGNIWVSLHNRGIAKYDGKSFSIYTKEEGLAASGDVAFMEDSKHNLWIASKGNEITKYDGEHFNQYSLKESLSKTSVRTIMEDQEGNIWFGTRGGEISIYDGKSFQYFDSQSGLPNGGINSLLQDHSGNIWIGTDGGLIKYGGDVLRNFTKKDGLPSEIVWSVLKDSTGRCWFGTSEGLAYYEDNAFKQIPSFDGMTGMFVGPMILDLNHHLWFNLYGLGLARHDGKNITLLTQEPGLKGLGAEALFVDENNVIWIGTNGTGLLKYDGKNIKKYLKGVTGISDPDILTFLKDKDKRLWIGTYGGGITVIDRENYFHYKLSNGFISDYVACIYEDTQGDIWIGTLGDGLCKCTLSNENHILSCIQITEKQGLTNNRIHVITEDKSHNILVGTSNGLSILPQVSVSKLEDYKDGHAEIKINHLIKNITYSEGLLGVGVIIGKTMLPLDDGNIWIATDDRLSSFNSLQYERSTDTIGPNIQLMSVKLFNENIDWIRFSRDKDTAQVLENGVLVKHVNFDNLSRWYALPENLSLSFNNNYLTFNYIGITLHQPQKVKYQYMLDGNDKKWSALTSSTEAHYGNLSHGSYTFKVKAINGDGYWSKEFQYPFTIRPPWWLTWWAYSLYGITFLSGMWRLNRYQHARTIRLEREKTREKELSHAKEIEKAYTELKETQAQLIQREKMASLGELTAGIAHEIQNPLNFVNNFSEVNKELLVEMNEEIEKGNLNEVKSIAKDVIDNEEKINHHGKRADAIVKGMLMHSRTSSGVKEPTDINVLTDEYLRLAYHGLRAKDKSFNATMKTDFDESIGLINIIPQDIGRVILNLITNAFYAVSHPLPPKGGPDYEPIVSVSTKKTIPPSGGRGTEGSTVEIRIKDNGPGIPRDVVDKIFQPFFTTKPTGQGTGLGLSLSYDIVKAHGGELKVETKVGEGTTFIIQLPIV